MKRYLPLLFLSACTTEGSLGNSTPGTPRLVGDPQWTSVVWNEPYRSEASVYGTHDELIFVGTHTIPTTPGLQRYQAVLQARAMNDGRELWRREITGDSSMQLEKIEVDRRDGSFVAGGSFYGTVDLGAGHTATSPGGSMMLARFSAMGEPVWSLALHSTHSAVVTSVAITPAGQIYVAVGVTGTLATPLGTIAPPPLSEYEYTSVLLAVSESGALRWVQDFAGRGIVAVNVVEEDVIVSVDTYTPGAPEQAVFVRQFTRFASDGTLGWSSQEYPRNGRTDMSPGTRRGDEIAFSTYVHDEFRSTIRAIGSDGDERWESEPLAIQLVSLADTSDGYVFISASPNGVVSTESPVGDHKWGLSLSGIAPDGEILDVHSLGGAYQAEQSSTVGTLTTSSTGEIALSVFTTSPLLDLGTGPVETGAGPEETATMMMQFGPPPTTD